MNSYCCRFNYVITASSPFCSAPSYLLLIQSSFYPARIDIDIMVQFNKTCVIEKNFCFLLFAIFCNGYSRNIRGQSGGRSAWVTIIWCVSAACAVREKSRRWSWLDLSHTEVKWCHCYINSYSTCHEGEADLPVSHSGGCRPTGHLGQWPLVLLHVARSRHALHVWLQFSPKYPFWHATVETQIYNSLIYCITTIGQIWHSHLSLHAAVIT